MINNKSPILTLLYDLSKAFDTIDHNILIKKLKYAGLNRKCFEIIKNYLSNRMQYWKVNGKCSELKQKTCGVPQGSILGPLFFIIYIYIYINGMTTYVKDMNLYMQMTLFFI